MTRFSTTGPSLRRGRSRQAHGRRPEQRRAPLSRCALPRWSRGPRRKLSLAGGKTPSSGGAQAWPARRTHPPRDRDTPLISPGGPMPTPPSQPPGAGRTGPTPEPGARQPRPTPEPGARQPRPTPEPGTGRTGPTLEPGARQPRPTPKLEIRKTRRQGCQREAGRPLPDPAAVRLCAVPDSAPPYDDEALAGTRSAGTAHTASTDGSGGTAAGGQESDNGRGPRRPIPDPARPNPARPRSARPDSADPSGGNPDRRVAPGWPSLFAQVLAETLAGSRPAGQIVPWTTQRARSNIQRLGPTLAAGQPTARQRPLVRRVVTSQPSSDVLEMTVIVGFGPRIRALAVRLELSQPRGIPAGRPARWLCTAVEAA